MNVSAFRKAFWTEFKGAERNRPDHSLLEPSVSEARDLCADVPGKLSLKKQQLLNMAFAMLPENESYLEVGTYMGKSLLSAMLGNPQRTVYAVDNFSEFEENSFEVLKGHLEHYGVYDQITFCNADFREVFQSGEIQTPIGLYFYDGGHDYRSQYDAIKLVEPFLADEALILVDDWRFAPDSHSYAREGSLRAAFESANAFRVLYELPARYNGDLAMWWNGLGVLSFQRETALCASV